MHYKTEWSPINESLERILTPQGWLVRTRNRDSLIFVPDPEISWNPTNKQQILVCLYTKERFDFPQFAGFADIYQESYEDALEIIQHQFHIDFMVVSSRIFELEGLNSRLLAQAGINYCILEDDHYHGLEKVIRNYLEL